MPFFVCACDLHHLISSFQYSLKQNNLILLKLHIEIFGSFNGLLTIKNCINCTCTSDILTICCIHFIQNWQQIFVKFSIFVIIFIKMLPFFKMACISGNSHEVNKVAEINLIKCFDYTQKICYADFQCILCIQSKVCISNLNHF